MGFCIFSRKLFTMKIFKYILFCSVLISSCSSKKTITNKASNSDDSIVRIANDELEYEIIIFDPGFSTWLNSVAQPEGYYTQEFLEVRNRQYVVAWNQRVQQPLTYGNLYAMVIDYDPNIDYGYEVNYKLYNYFIYFQLTNKQQLTSFVPRI